MWTRDEERRRDEEKEEKNEDEWLQSKNGGKDGLGDEIGSLETPHVDPMRGDER